MGEPQQKRVKYTPKDRIYNTQRSFAPGAQCLGRDTSRMQALCNAYDESLYEEGVQNGVADPVRQFLYFETKGIFHPHKWTTADIADFRAGKFDFPESVKEIISSALTKTNEKGQVKLNIWARDRLKDESEKVANGVAERLFPQDHGCRETIQKFGYVQACRKGLLDPFPGLEQTKLQKISEDIAGLKGKHPVELRQKSEILQNMEHMDAQRVSDNTKQEGGADKSKTLCDDDMCILFGSI